MASKHSLLWETTRENRSGAFSRSVTFCTLTSDTRTASILTAKRVSSLSKTVATSQASQAMARETLDLKLVQSPEVEREKECLDVTDCHTHHHRARQATSRAIPCLNTQSLKEWRTYVGKTRRYVDLPYSHAKCMHSQPCIHTSSTLR